MTRIESNTDPSERSQQNESQQEPKRLVISARQARRRIQNGTLPPGCTIVGNLTFPESISATIPPDTHIRGSLLMLWMSDVKLGVGLRVACDADLSMSEIEHIPSGMVVGGNLILVHTTVRNKLPDDLKVGGLIYLGTYASEELWDRAAEAKRNYDTEREIRQTT